MMRNDPDMEDKTAAFLAAHTIECAPMHARISRKQCGANIRFGAMPHCRDCPEAASADLSEGDTGKSRWGRKPQQQPQPVENVMPEPSRNTPYTQADIAAMAGVARGSMWHALNQLRTNKRKLSPTALRIKAALDTLGITVTQIAPGGWDAVPASDVVPAPEPARKTAINQDFEDAIAAMEAEGAARTARVDTSADRALAADVAEPSSARNAENPSVADTEKSGPYGVCRALDSSDASQPLERLLAQIRERLPRGATITISL